MLGELLDTKVKIKIAELFVSQHEPLTVSDVSRKLNISKSRASECLRELSEKGILTRKDIGRNAVYSMSSGSAAQIVKRSLTQNIAIVPEIEKALAARIRKLKPASLVLFGSALRGLKIGSDVDFLLIYKDKIDEDEVYRISSDMTVMFGFHVSVIMMELDEFKSKANRAEGFVLNVIATHKLVYGKDLEGLAWPKK